MPTQSFNQISYDRSLLHLERYFALLDNGRQKYTGAKFEAIGDPEATLDCVTAADLLAVSMLSVNVPAYASIGILEDLGDQIEELLRMIPVSSRIEELKPADLDSVFGPIAPATKLWNLLRQKEDSWGVGPTTASKIMARKRPHLIPIYDSVIADLVGMPNSAEQWTLWFAAFHGENGKSFTQKLQNIRKASGQEHLSLLRVLDIVLWMEGQDRKRAKRRLTS